MVLRFEYREVLLQRFMVLSLGISFFSSFFLISCVVCFRHKKPYTGRAIKRKKTYKSQQLPASSLHGKNQRPQNNRKSPPCLASEIIYPRRVRKQFIERYR